MALTSTTDSAAQLFKMPDLAMLGEVGLIVLAAALLIAAIQRLLPWVGNRLHGKRRLHLLALVPVLRLGLILLAFVLVVPLVINPSMQNMVALLGASALALGFALKDYVSSLIAGLVAVGETPYRNGDWVQIDGVYGEVRHVGLRALQLVTPDDTVVTVPHARLWTEPVHNANDGSPRLLCVAEFHLHPRHDAALVRELLADVALTSPYLFLEQPVAVLVQEKPWGTLYQVKAYPVDARQQFRFVSDLTVRGKAALARIGAAAAAATFAVDGR